MTSRLLLRLALPAIALAASGCEPREASAPLATPASTTAAPASLVGEWRVAAIDGESPDAPIGIALTIDDKTMLFDPRCAGFIWRYRYADGVLETARGEAGGPRAICEIAILPQQAALAAALDAATRAERTPANAVVLTGGGHSVTLFGQ